MKLISEILNEESKVKVFIYEVNLDEYQVKTTNGLSKTFRGDNSLKEANEYARGITFLIE